VRTTSTEEDFEVWRSIAGMAVCSTPEHQDKEGGEKTPREFLKGCALPVHELRAS